MKNRKQTKHAGIFTFEDKNGKTKYGLKFRHKGTQIQKQGYSTLNVAKQARREIEIAIEDGSYFKRDYTLDEYWEIYKSDKIKNKKWNLSTEALATDNYSNHLKSAFGSKLLSNITKREVEQFIATKLLTLRRATVRQIFMLLSSILEYAYINEDLDRNRAKGITVGQSNLKPYDKTISEEDYNKLINYVYETQDVMTQGIICLLSLALRRAEVVALKESNVSYQDDTVKIVINQSRPKRYPNGKETKTNNERFIFGNAKHAQIIKNLVVESKKRYLAAGKTYISDSWIFVYPNGRPFQADKVTNMFREINKKLGTAITPHKLRHYFASQAQSQNVNPRLIADFLGHKKTTMTDHYSHQTEQGTLHVISQVSDRL